MTRARARRCGRSMRASASSERRSAIRLGDKQYVAVLAGWGGSLPGAFGAGVAQHGWSYGAQPRRLLVFALGAHEKLKVVPPSAPAIPVDDPKLAIDTQAATQGSALFNSNCQLCHGFGAIAGGVAPDLRASMLALNQDAFRTVVKDGLLESRGMPRFAEIDDEDLRRIYWYIRERARADLEAKGVSPVGLPTGG